MQERLVDIETNDGLMNTYVFHPDGPGPFPVVIFYMDSVGVREELSDMCRRIASVGYYVLLPNMYYRKVRCVDLDADRIFRPECADQLELMWMLNRHLTNTMVMDDTRSMLAHVDSDPAASPGPVGIVGYCMSGRYTFAAAGVFADRIKAAASMYGARLITDQPDSAHLSASKISGEMYFGCAEHDDYFSSADVARLKEIMETAGVKFRIELYPEAIHGFAFPGRRDYQKKGAERHWERLFDLFRRNIG